MQKEWTDEHLTWNANDYGGINEMVFMAWEIWTPDIRSWAAASQVSWWRSVAKEPLRVNSSGVVSWWTRAVVTSYCDVDLSQFPFDKQFCSIGFVSWTYDISELNITDHPLYKKQIYGPFVKNPEWSVVAMQVHKNSQNESVGGYWPKIMAELTLQRRSNFYLYTTGFPYLASGLLVVSSFLFPVASMRRYYLLILSMVIYSCILLQLAARLGSHSIKVPYAVKCVVYSMLLVAISITVNIVSACVIDKLARKKNCLMPRAIASFVESPWLGTLCCLNPSSLSKHDNSTPFSSSSHVDTQSSSNPHSNQPDLPSEWHLLQQLLDRICFVSFIVASIIYHS